MHYRRGVKYEATMNRFTPREFVMREFANKTCD